MAASLGPGPSAVNARPRPADGTGRDASLLGLDPDQVDEAGLRSGPGCGFCAQTGYQGRLGLFEVAKVTRKMRELIVARATQVAIKEEAAASGMRSMRADGLAKALAGRTTLEEVLRIASAERPDLVLVDLDLPGVDPARLLASLREPSARDLPVLVMSATDDRPTRARAAAAGATAFIPKPFGEAELRSEVAAPLQRQPALVEHPA
jgi:CheY-like chemotaxis protein